MTKYARLSRAKIKAAIPESGGLIARIAKASGYSWGATRDFIAADPELAEMVRDEEERIDDMAESAIIKRISEGDEGSAKWWLSRRRRSKFGDSVDVTSGGEPLKIVVEYARDKNNPTESA